MKNNILQTITFAFIVILWLFPHKTAVSQNVIFDIPSTVSINSLIREYERGQHIVYNNNGTSSFFFINEMGFPAPSATEAVIPNLYSVSDMEIVGEKLYFCGNYNGQQVIGRFQVNKLFSGTGQVEIIYVNYYPLVNGYTGNLTLNKIEVQEIAQNDIHVYVIGDVVFGAPSQAPDYTVLFDAMYNGSYWDFEDIHDQSGVYRFYDMAITNSSLVVYGEKYGGQAEYYNVCPIPLAGNNHLVASPFLYMYGSSGYSFFPISKTLLEALPNNEFATACYGNFGGDSGIVISRFQTPNILLGRWFLPNITMSKSFRDLKYSPRDSVLYLVPEISNSVVTDLIYVFNISRETAQVYQSSIPQLCSVDQWYYGNGAIISGITQAGEVAFWVTKKSDCQCAKAINLSVIHNVHTVSPWLMPINTSTFTRYSWNISANINNYSLNETCRYNYKSDEDDKE